MPGVGERVATVPAKEFTEKRRKAKEQGLVYCGWCRLVLEPADFHFGNICESCRRGRLVHRSTYRPPRVRQSLAAIAPPTSRAEVLAAVAAGHAETAEVFESRARLVAAEITRAEARESALSALVELQAPVKASRTPVGGFSPVGAPDTADHTSTPVEESREVDSSSGDEGRLEAVWQTEDLETQARLDALRQQLKGENQ